MAKKYKAFKYRIYPTPEQETLINKTFGCVRLVYNYYLEQMLKLHNENKPIMQFNACIKDLALLKNDEKYSFLKEVDPSSLEQTLIHLERAFKIFLNSKDKKIPKFKSKKRNVKSYSTNNFKRYIIVYDNYVQIPIVDKIKLNKNREIPENYKIKSATITKSASDKYYISLLCEYNQNIEKINPTTFLGLDYSMGELYVDSNGHLAAYPHYYRKKEMRFKREQRKLSRMQFGSNNYYKQRKKIARIYEKTSNQRKDFLHKQSRWIANNYDCVCIESLNMQNLAGKNKFGKSVYDNAWGIFVAYLQYKLEDLGKQLIKIDKYFPSSQVCSNCGYQNWKIHDFTIKEWDCPRCGSHHHRDQNAAINIKKEGMRIALA